MPKGASQFDICAATTPSRSTATVSAMAAISVATEPASETQRPQKLIRTR
jgi:hypothetical protein